MNNWSDELSKRDLKIMEKYAKEKPWGLLTSIDLHDCDPISIKDRGVIKNFVIKLCGLLQMRRYGEPTLVRFGNDPNVTGFSLSQMIETSEISGHFAESSNAVYIDIFSCKAYPPYKTARFVKKFFKAKTLRFRTHFRY